MASNDSIINAKSDRVNNMTKLHSIHIRIYITIYHTYKLLNFKGYIQMMSNESTINVETKTIE